MLLCLLALLALASAQDLNCGESSTWQGVGLENPQIVGGTEAPRHAYPWQVSLERCSSWGCSHACGAVLISSNYVITAAHCVASYAMRAYIFVVGQHERAEFEKGDERRIQPSQITKHPDWKNNRRFGFPNDIAVVRLSTPAKLDNTTVVPAIIPSPANGNFTSRECWISGWGRTHIKEPVAKVLHHARVDILSNEDCRERWGGKRIQDYHICIFDLAGQERGACVGDGGGPLNCKADESSWMVAGVASWGIRGCMTYYPSVYSRTSYFRDWISKQTNEELC